jgi:two-component system sensor histidine kinase/response regulator
VSFPFPSSGNSKLQSILANLIRDAVFLVVDDFDVMRRVTADHLRTMGAKRVLVADNGQSAMQILATEPVTIILSDWNMPVKTGLDLLIHVRSNPRTAHMPFVMITGEAERDRVEAVIRAGVSELLVKPYTQVRLAERVERALARGVPMSAPPQPRAAAVPEPAPVAGGVPAQGFGPGPTAVPAQGFVPAQEAAPLAPAQVPEPQAAASADDGAGDFFVEGPDDRPTILVVDDTAENLRLMSHLFEDQYRVLIAHSGEKALKICHGVAPPDLVLLDVLMPGLDGLEVARQLRAHPSSAHLPIIFVTSADDDATRLRGLELGAIDVVHKPVNPHLMRVRVRNFMQVVESRRQLQTNYDNMIHLMRLSEDVERITRHDMKGQLAGVIGLLQTLVQAKEPQREQLQLAEESALRLVDMINLSSEIYKIETGRFVLRAEPIALSHIVQRIAELTSKAFAVRGLRIAVAAAPDVTALGDAMLCYSLFQNLLKNACEAAPDSSEVKVRLSAGKTCTVTIENQGVVPADMRERFFDKYATSGKAGGTGLGTYSARLLAQAQLGDILMQTSDDRGTTTITVALPAS